MEPTLGESLNELMRLIGEDKAQQPPTNEGNGGVTEPETPESLPGKKTSAEEKLQQLTDLFTAYKKAVSASQWEESGRIMDQIDKLLNQ